MTLADRRAAVNKWLLVVLAVLAVGAGISWFVKIRQINPVAADLDIPRLAEYPLYCSNCGKVMVSAADAKKLPRREGMLECPKCKKASGTWVAPSAIPGTAEP